MQEKQETRARPMWKKAAMAAAIVVVLCLAILGLRHLRASPAKTQDPRLVRVAAALKAAHAAKAVTKWLECSDQATLALDLEEGRIAVSTNKLRVIARPAIVKEATALIDEAEEHLLPPPDPSKYPKMNEPWVNSLEMQFVPVKGTEVLFAVVDISNGEYQKFRPEHDSGDYQFQSLKNFHQPVVSVTWEDAKAYCAWLTKRDRRAGKIALHHAYRLPKDWEWSVAVGLNEKNTGSPQAKDELVSNVYPWGPSWPPPRDTGNYGDSLRLDDYPVTSPVGCFKANDFGLFDMSGNVWQWCEDFYDGRSGARVLRGGSWGVGNPRLLRSAYRFSGEPGGRDNDMGFRVVLATVAPPKAKAKR